MSAGKRDRNRSSGNRVDQVRLVLGSSPHWTISQKERAQKERLKKESLHKVPSRLAIGRG
jgi:hypothetical protein